jgi:hypothetical protein
MIALWFRHFRIARVCDAGFEEDLAIVVQKYTKPRFDGAICLRLRVQASSHRKK